VGVDAPTTRLRLRVIPGAGRTGIDGRYGDAWKIRVAVAPERGRANDAVVELLTSALGVPRGRVEIVGGHASRDKVVAVHGLGGPEVDARLGASAAERAGAR
jgi:uncharacterized protein YggU (UPF0235/DUF167 family)